MSDPQATAGHALRSELAPFHQAQGKRLTAVLQSDDGEAEAMVFAFGTDGLMLRCNVDTDALAISFAAIPHMQDAVDLSADPAWSRYISKELFQAWLTVNQHGYVDGVLLSFDGVVPEIGLNVVASAFETLEIRQQPS